MASSNIDPNALNFLVWLRARLKAYGGRKGEDYAGLGLFNFVAAAEDYMRETGVADTHMLDLASTQVKFAILNQLIRILRAERENVTNYVQNNPMESPRSAARNYFENNTGTRGEVKNIVLLRDVYKPCLEQLDALLTDSQLQRMAAEVFANNKPEVPGPNRTVRELFDQAFLKEYGSLSDGVATPEMARPTPPVIYENALERERKTAASPGGFNDSLPQSFVDETWRGGGLYAFTWWRVKRGDAGKLRDGNHYPRNRGDLKAGYTETPNKHLTNLLAGIGGKEEGRVDGLYLGWMGLTEKGALEGKGNGQAVPPFTLGEDEVIMLGAARIKKFDLLRLRFNGVKGWSFDWTALHWKWDVWDPKEHKGAQGAPLTSSIVSGLKDKKYQELHEKLEKLKSLENVKGNHNLFWTDKETLKIIVTIWQDLQIVINADNAFLPRLGQAREYVTTSELLYYCLKHAIKQGIIKQKDVLSGIPSSHNLQVKLKKALETAINESMGGHTFHELVEGLQWLVRQLDGIKAERGRS